MSTSYTERLKRLEERAEQIKEQTKELKKIATKQNRKLIDKRKTVVGALQSSAKARKKSTQEKHLLSLLSVQMKRIKSC